LEGNAVEGYGLLGVLEDFIRSGNFGTWYYPGGLAVDSNRKSSLRIGEMGEPHESLKRARS
jgi:hypothetical protein